ncbi:hypothetical protein CLIB1444_14S01574 [[Candida] jaroonii]|uniref:Uncharacterized protein n=1 Tax=[Candida] jaroonii TaxID=467808 RepID=A0ACA9YE14_9ASCO|nr:hypothetical protein CLIB1444_14S01574 [[Candida] jaroonii]
MIRPRTLVLKRFKSLPSTPNSGKPVKPDGNNSTPSSVNQPTNLTPRDWKVIEGYIPGEKTQTNELKDRVPKFPLGKENVPTLLPRPGVPRVGKDHTFRQVITILRNKRQEELIYESEPHRLYFLACFCFGLTLLVYAIVLGEWAVFQANKDYEENKEEKNEVLKKREWFLNVLKNSIFCGIMLGASYAFFTFPQRLVRRMYYLPGPVEHVKFTSYPLLPGRPTPVITIPLKHLERKHQARVWTGKGFYGTSDSSLFFFTLKEINESGKTVKNWVVDRRGFFWSDGRVFDFLFGKETLAESEAGIPYDEQVGILNKELKKKKEKLRKEHGRFWNFKLMAKEVSNDIKKLTGNQITKRDN